MTSPLERRALYARAQRAIHAAQQIAARSHELHDDHRHLFAPDTGPRSPPTSPPAELDIRDNAPAGR